MIYFDNLSEQERIELNNIYDTFKSEVVILMTNSNLFEKSSNHSDVYKSKNSIFSSSKGLEIHLEDGRHDFMVWFQIKGQERVHTSDFLGMEIYENKDFFKTEIYRPFRFKNYDSIEVGVDYFVYRDNMMISNKEKIFLETLNQKLSYDYYQKFDKYYLNREKKLVSVKKKILKKVNPDGKGIFTLVDCETFGKILSKNQKTIITFDKSYIQKFVKISNFLKTKRDNIEKILESIKQVNNEKELYELMGILNNKVHTYELLLFHSINMITSVIENDLITFYEVYECFDELGIFNSNWENEVSNKLTEIGSDLKNLMYSINEMENRIVHSIKNLTYLTYDSFTQLNHSVENQLKSVNSTLKYNNLLTGLQTYKLYVINEYTTNRRR
jgi:hypothetical protein